MGKLCITGATGGLGSRVLHHLLHTLNVDRANLIVSLHTPSKIPSEYARCSLDVRKGDFTDPDSLRVAFAGATSLLIVSYPSIAYDIRVAAHRHAIDVAKEVGIQHIYYTSLAFATDSQAAVMQAHIATEAYLKQSGIAWTIVREGIYSESFSLYLGLFDKDALESVPAADRQVVVGGEGKIAFVSRDDLGQGTARILVAPPDEYSQKTVLLSGSTAVELRDVAATVSNILDWKPALRLETVRPAEYIETQLAAKEGKAGGKFTRDYLTDWATSYPALARGELSVVDPLLETLLGRKTVPLEVTLRQVLLDE